MTVVDRWEIIRLEILDRDDHKCQMCGGHADQVDHIFPRRRGGSNDPENLQALCGRCNKQKDIAADYTQANSLELISGVADSVNRISREFNEFIRPAIAELIHRWDQSTDGSWLERMEGGYVRDDIIAAGDWLNHLGAHFTSSGHACIDKCEAVSEPHAIDAPIGIVEGSVDGAVVVGRCVLMTC